MKRVAHTVWISDLHLGTDVCNHSKLLDFLKSFESIDGLSYNLKRLYLVGDIIDMTQMSHSILWSRHRTVIKKFLRMADKGVEIVYIPGNHDYLVREELLHSSDEANFNGIIIRRNDIYTTLTGKKYLIVHGDEFDGVVRVYPWLYAIGDAAYSILIWINNLQNKFRRVFKLPEWSLSLWLKTKTKQALQFINNYEKLLVEEASKNGTDGIICGHIHKAEDVYINGIHYLNTGCFTEFCSAVIETDDGVIKLEYI